MPPPQLFARSPADAVQCLLDLRHTMQRIHDDGSAADPAHPNHALIGDAAGWADWQRGMASVETIYWPSATAGRVTAASATYPLVEEVARPLDQAAGTYARPSYLP